MKKQELSNLLNTKLSIPTKEEIEEVKLRIQSRLAEKPMNRFSNFSVKEGYTKSLKVLESGTLDYEGLKTVQGRAIAAITLDYLKGTCSAETLCNVPIK